MVDIVIILTKLLENAIYAKMSIRPVQTNTLNILRATTSAMERANVMTVTNASEYIILIKYLHKHFAFRSICFKGWEWYWPESTFTRTNIVWTTRGFDLFVKKVKTFSRISIFVAKISDVWFDASTFLRDATFPYCFLYHFQRWRISFFSQFPRLKRIVCWFCQFSQKCSSEPTKTRFGCSVPSRKSHFFNVFGVIWEMSLKKFWFDSVKFLRNVAPNRPKRVFGCTIPSWKTQLLQIFARFSNPIERKSESAEISKRLCFLVLCTFVKIFFMRKNNILMPCTLMQHSLLSFWEQISTSDW